MTLLPIAEAQARLFALAAPVSGEPAPIAAALADAARGSVRISV